MQPGRSLEAARERRTRARPRRSKRRTLVERGLHSQRLSPAGRRRRSLSPLRRVAIDKNNQENAGAGLERECLFAGFLEKRSKLGLWQKRT